MGEARCGRARPSLGQRTRAEAWRVLGHMGEDVLGTTSESSGREGTLSVDALRCMEGLG